jgi:hypothetical protein
VGAFFYLVILLSRQGKHLNKRVEWVGVKNFDTWQWRRVSIGDEGYESEWMKQ